MHQATLFTNAVKGGMTKQIPCWFMRQAGRYLPEYQETRAKAGGFLNLCFNPDLAAEVTLQPIRRFDMDAAIIFSDILMAPIGLGRKVWFEEGEGPRLDPITCAEDIQKISFENFHEKVAPVYEAIRVARKLLPPEKSLIGFAGAPFTIACYMIEGRGSRDFAKAKAFAYREPEAFDQLIQILIKVTAEYLHYQVESGADCVQIFDSWAGLLPQPWFDKWVIRPTRHITRNLRQGSPNIPVIGFPKGAGILYKNYAQNTSISCVSLDMMVEPKWAHEELQPIMTVQGNLDPVLLLAGGKAMADSAQEIMTTLSKGPFIFNLGHGIIKETPPQHVADLIKIIRANRRQ